LPASCLAAMLIGALLGLQGVVMPILEPGILISLVLLGVLAFGWLRPGIASAFALTAIAAIWHGDAHVHDSAGVGSELGYIAGFMTASGILQIVGIAIGALRRTILRLQW